MPFCNVVPHDIVCDVIPQVQGSMCLMKNTRLIVRCTKQLDLTVPCGPQPAEVYFFFAIRCCEIILYAYLACILPSLYLLFCFWYCHAYILLFGKCTCVLWLIPIYNSHSVNKSNNFDYIEISKKTLSESR